METDRADRRRIAGLLALNGLLLAALGVVSFAPAVDAQQRRSRGAYTMVSAQTQGFTEDAIYVIDATNQELLAVRYDRSARGLRFVGFRDLRFDVRQATQGGR
ncbi:MAG: hypothetical protein EA380_01095 [Phycisphaeraceae bacterium]|nr:MAG: hypothetical protein EA380_01095 [Phycisphaeraceae bacterium]